jgi:hypothetical protein
MLLSNSLLRSSYEIYFNPLPRQVVRGTKTLVDVAATRIGDIPHGFVRSGARLTPGFDVLRRLNLAALRQCKRTDASAADSRQAHADNRLLERFSGCRWREVDGNS